MKVVEAKAIMARIAQDYERIAKLVEQLRERKQGCPSILQKPK